MQETHNQTADAEASLPDNGCRRHSISQWTQKSLYQTANAGDTLLDSNCRNLYQTADSGDTLSISGCRSLSIRQLSIRQWMQETLYLTADAGDTLSESGCRSVSIRQRMQESLYQTFDEGHNL